VTLWSEVKVYLLCAFAVLALALPIAYAAWPEKPKEYPGHRNVWADYEHLKDYDVVWTWQDTIAAHDYCNVVTLEDLHPVSLKFLYVWHRGLLTDQQFLEFFGMPNSEYIDAAQCIVRQKHIPNVWIPHA
jgi:hypothetical protein